MPRTYGLEDEVKMSNVSCGNIRDDFKDCVLNSDCVKKENNKPSYCVTNELIGEECDSLRALMFECKRSLVSISNNSFN